MDTTKITKHFANQVSKLSVHGQRKLISLLFFWEEELMRWRLMDAEEEQIQIQKANVAADAQTGDGFETALRVLQANRILLPSKRTEAGASVQE